MRSDTNFQNEIPAALPPRGEDRNTLRALVDRAIAQSSTPEQAEQLALAEAGIDQHLAEEAMRLGIRQIIGEARTKLRASMIRERRAEWSAGEKAPKSFAGAAVVRQSFYNWPLPNSAVMLGDAGLADLEAAAVFHDAHRDAHANRGTAYRQIAGILRARGAAASVRNVMAEAELAKIMAGTPS